MAPLAHSLVMDTNRATTGSTSSSPTSNGPDTTPPSVTAVNPANAATNVSTTTTVSATFSEAIDPTTISASTFQLFAPGNTLVSGTVTYNSGTASFLPGAALATSTIYTAKITGGNGGVKDLAGNAMTANFTWSFTTAAAQPPPGSCPCNIWSAATVPSQVDSGDSSAVELFPKLLIRLVNQHPIPTRLLRPLPRRSRVTRLIVRDRSVECRFQKRASPFQKTCGRDGADFSLDDHAFAMKIASALKSELKDRNSRAKLVAGWTGANERTVKNWILGRYAPCGRHLVILAQHSDQVLHAILSMADRQDLLLAPKVRGSEAKGV